MTSPVFGSFFFPPCRDVLATEGFFDAFEVFGDEVDIVYLA